VDQDRIPDLKQQMEQFFKKIIKNETASFTISQYMGYEATEVCISAKESNMV
jgi:hypothetical protein